jgi:predicted glycogen debranching enzyme
MIFDKKIISDFAYAQSLEWLETNGLGGYACGTVSGAHSRRYHGLLVAATNPPVGRVNLLSKLDETIIYEKARFELGANQYPGAVHPQGYKFLKNFKRELFPEFYFEAGGIELKKTIAAIREENTTLILYEVTNAPSKFELELLPLYASRDFHSLSHANDYISKQYIFDDGIFRTLNYHGCPELFIMVPQSQFIERRGWYFNFQYSQERQRGMDFEEDLYTHGSFRVELKKGDRLSIIVSTENPLGRDAWQIFSTETKRREQLIKPFSYNDYLRRLSLAADQFIVSRGNHKSIIAGYPWFSDWGRDTMISLPGLCLVTGRFAEAKEILQEFSEYVSEGMLPNRFPDHGEAPEYNTIDATLWFFYAIHQYYKYTGDKSFIKSLIPLLEDIIKWHYRGTRYNIKVDPEDELLNGGAEGVQLTWMDAKVGNWVVTPRSGKAVEINALWYNALSILSMLLEEVAMNQEAEKYQLKAGKVLRGFNRVFWNENKNSLYDYVDGDYKNDAIRPNQIYALSLPFRLLEREKEEKVFDTVSKHLLTAKGLRSLSPSHKDYKPTYNGDIWSRDGAYHQGSVWSFLIGPYIDALFHVKEKKGKEEAVQIIANFLDHLDEAGVGTVSEIFDAEAPYTCRGCIAQAWGVAEVLRVAMKYSLFEKAVDATSAKS